MTTVVLLTSDELRHRFLRMAVALHEDVQVLRSYCEAPTASLAATLAARGDVAPAEQAHLDARTRAEEDVFGPFCALAPDLSNRIPVERGAINGSAVVEEIIASSPDVVAAFGCSIVADPLIRAFPDRILNLHLGLSPYYRGSGTNLWPLVNDEPELVGATFMYLDEGIDTGEIIHQLRARVVPGDDQHRIGNRLIADAAIAMGEVLAVFDRLGHVPQPDTVEGRAYRRADVTPDTIRRLTENLQGGMVERYLQERAARIERTPIVQHPLLAPGSEAS